MQDVIIDNVKGLTANLLRDKAIELVDLMYRRERPGMVLRFLVDKEGGITLNECAELNERIGALLDAEDVIPDKYTLEISSPGLDRPLRTKRDFERVMGREVRVHMYAPVNDKKDYEGVVSGVDDEKVTIGEISVPLNKISKAKQKVKI